MRKFRGYSDAKLQTLPRVSTETGWDAPTEKEERVQGIVLVNTFLAQFKRGWRYTFIYELGEGEGGGGHQGLFHENWTPKLAAINTAKAIRIPIDFIKILQSGIAKQRTLSNSRVPS